MWERRNLLILQILELDHRADEPLELLALRRRQSHPMGIRAHRTVSVVLGGRVEGPPLRGGLPVAAAGRLGPLHPGQPCRRGVDEGDGNRSVDEVHLYERVQSLD